MNKTYSFYIDESGMFQAIDTHVICPLIIEDNAVTMEEIIELWSQIYPEGWTGFHATDMKNKGEGQRVFDVAEHLGRALFSRQGVQAAYAFHRSEEPYGYDFYPGMLVFLLEWQSKEILNTEVQQWAGSPDETLHVHVHINIAARQLLNPFILKELLLKYISKQIQKLVTIETIKPGQIHFDFFPYYEAISNNPFMQISDVYSNLVRARLKNGRFERKIDEVIEGFAHVELPVSKINGKVLKSQSKALRRQNVGEKIIYKTKEISVIRTVTQRSWFETLLERVLESQRSGKRLTSHALEDFLNAYRKNPEGARTASFQPLLGYAAHVLQEERNYELGSLLVDMVYDLIHWERDSAGLSPEFLDECELKTAELFVASNNHLGNFLADAQQVKQGLDVCERLRENISFWLNISSFHTHLAVSLQNVFRFDESIEKLFPIVQYYEQELKNPFSGGGARAYELGALFGTYAQSLAFSGHCRFFTEGEAVLSALENAELYSMLSEEHFDKPQDVERQIVYRVHFKMQRYILSGDRASLEEAGHLLENEDENQKAVCDFKEVFPEKGALLPAYRLVVLLKHAYLSRNPPDWTKEIADLILQNRSSIPADHPMEEMIPYLILLTENPNTKRTLMGVLLQLNFPSNIVSVIRDVLLLQINYDMEKSVDDQLLQRIDQCVTDEIKPQWERYGLGRVLEAYKKPVNRWHVGPMEVLPFNYC